MHVRVLLAKPCDGVGHYLAAECKHGQHLQSVCHFAVSQAGGQTLDFTELLVELFDMGEQGCGFVGGREASAHTLEQRKAQLQFCMLQRAADGRLCDVQQPCGGTDAAGLHHSMKDFNVFEAHGMGVRQGGAGSLPACKKCT